MRHDIAPRVATCLLKCFLPPTDREAVLGDLIEEYAMRARSEPALLTFNLVNYGKLPNRSESVLARWNYTEVYFRSDGKWKIIHSHWSYIRPEVKQQGS